MSTNVQTGGRLDFIDAHRGLAVLLMLWMHTADGWLRPELKHGAAWGWVRAVGGFAAPAFLLLAGLSLGLGWVRPSRPAQRRVEVARGLQLVILGYALRLQMWMLDAAGYRHASCWVAAVSLAFAYLASHRSLGAWARSAPEAAWLGRLGLVGFTAGLATVSIAIPDRLIPLLRVDVLQAIGASLACLALLHRQLRLRPWLGVVLGATVAVLTPWFRSWVPGPLPIPIAGYLAAWETPPGQLAPTLFPLFPWLAYALIGAVIGMRLGAAQHRDGGAARAALVLALLGAALALVTCEGVRPAHLLLVKFPVLTQPMRVAYRVGVSLVLGGFAVGLSHPRVPLRAGLLTLGRASLFVYWVHLELAFGGLSRPLSHKLGLAAWALHLAAMVVAMTALAALWLRVRERLWPPVARQPRPDDSATEPASLRSA